MERKIQNFIIHKVD